MTSRAGVLLVALSLGCASVAVLVVEDRRQGSREGRSEEFQRLVGGLGFGPALDLSSCPFGYDPRLDGSCAQEYAPLPGGTCFCPRHAGSVLQYPPPRHRVPLWLVEDSDAPPS
ncbi:MAG TPA: hypothetical protein VE999_00430 [Gemmataceae bacterium]|nr:hypothetical protein [Gemmataceae bacterium]